MNIEDETITAEARANEDAYYRTPGLGDAGSNGTADNTSTILREKQIKSLGMERTLAEALQLEQDEHFARDPGLKLYRYSHGAYRGRGEVFIATAVKRLLVSWRMSQRWRPALAEAVCVYILADCEDLWEVPPADRICLANGILHLDGRELHDHSPGWLSTLQLPVSYDPRAICPDNDAFMKRVYKQDAYDADVPCELEASFMLPASGNRKADLFIGDAGSGKSTRLNRLRLFLGARNVASLSLQKLETDRFAVAQLYGKLANIAPDLPSQDLETSSTFKTITGGDSITGEYKFKDSFSFVPFAHLAFSANQPPRARDASQAFFDRWRVHPFGQRIRGTAEEVPQDVLLARLCTSSELSGVLNKALDARERIIAHGYTVTPSMQAAFDELHEATDPFAVWCHGVLIENPDAIVPKAEVRRAYYDYSRENGIPAMTDTAFGVAMRHRYPRIDLKQRTVLGSLTWCYIGLGLRAAPQGSQTSQGSHTYNQSREKEESATTYRGNPVRSVNPEDSEGDLDDYLTKPEVQQ